MRRSSTENLFLKLSAQVFSLVFCKILLIHIWGISERYKRHMNYFAQFATIYIILETWKTPMEDCYFS